MINVNGEPATRIKAQKISQTDKAMLLDCEGDKIWFPKEYIKYDHVNKTVDIVDWLYSRKFPNG